ncbi:tRNA-uridine aminocarboxypropyltransferase A-like protein [Drosera capensis]
MASSEQLLPSLDPAPQPTRKFCPGICARPLSVCLCHVFPSNPIPMRTEIVVLHHPHEQKHKLATVPVLAKCLRDCAVVVGRRLRLGDSPVLDALYAEALDDSGGGLGRRAVFLFPGNGSMPSIEIDHWQSTLTDANSKGIVLIVFDGTWKHAKEMVSASLPFLSKFATCVCLSYDVAVAGGSIYDSELILRKEPFGGCMSTLEAVARALRVLEPAGGEIEEKLVSVLKAMVSLQSCHLKPMKARTEMLKKKIEEKGNSKSTGIEHQN